METLIAAGFTAMFTMQVATLGMIWSLRDRVGRLEQRVAHIEGFLMNGSHNPNRAFRVSVVDSMPEREQEPE